MLTIYKSNRAEWLAEVLAQQLKIDPPSPFELIEVVVHTWPTSRWLGEQLAIINGVNAQVQYPFPRTYLRKLVQRLLNKDDEEDPWKAKKLVWPILEILPEFIETEGGSYLKEWISTHNLVPNQINRGEWQLARSIADAFDDYILYRPLWVNNWIDKTDVIFNSSIQKLPKHSRWQPQLLRLLSKRINVRPLGKQIEEVIAGIEQKTITSKELPGRVSFFGLSRLAPIQIDLLKAISVLTDVQIFLITPCPDLWKRCRNKKERLINKWGADKKIKWSIENPKLENNLGRMGAEFQLLLEGSGENQIAAVQEHDLFASPKNLAAKQGREPTFLEQIQQSLITESSPKESLERSKSDASLLFVACPGTFREVQIIRDQILQWLENDKSLEPRDILIMTPQINKFSSLIAAVFNDKSGTGVELPWRITDRSHKDQPGLIQFIIELLEVANNRLTATTLESILANQALQDQQNITHDEINSINNHLQLAGFRWGLDKKERGGDAKHSLDWCLDRWILGLVLPSIPGLSPNEVAPYSEGIKLNDLKKWWALLSRLSKQIKILRVSHTCEEWIDLLKVILEDHFKEPGLWAYEKQIILNALEEWKRLAGESKLKITSQVVLEVLNEGLSGDIGKFGHRSGSITISAIEPMRAIPYRAIVLMGLDASIFPASDERQGFNLLEEKYHLGDPKRSQHERFVILETLISTRQHLMITWSNRDEITGESFPAPNPIQQWISQIRNELDQESLKGLVIEPASSPLDKSNFIAKEGRGPISCDRRNLDALLWIEKRLKPKNISLALPLKWNSNLTANKHFISYNSLENWLIAPQLFWLESINIRPKEYIQRIEDLESMELNELERYKIIKDRLEDLKEIISLKEKCSSQETIKGQWEYINKGNGLLPPKSASLIESELLEERWQSLQSLIFKNGPCKINLIEFPESTKEIVFSGEYALEVDPGRLKAKVVMKAWLMHLHLCAYKKSFKGTLVITRHSSRSKTNEYQLSLEFKPIKEKIALKSLDILRTNALKGLNDCWPIPPESGWALASAGKDNLAKGKKAFIDRWNGSFHNQGECKKEEMYICFGIDCDASIFLESKDFQEAFSILYAPLIGNLTT